MHIPPYPADSRKAPYDVRWHPGRDGESNPAENWHAAHGMRSNARNVSEKSSPLAGWSTGTEPGPHRANAWCRRPNPYARRRTARYPPGPRRPRCRKGRGTRWRSVGRRSGIPPDRRHRWPGSVPVASWRMSVPPPPHGRIHRHTSAWPGYAVSAQSSDAVEAFLPVP